LEKDAAGDIRKAIGGIGKKFSRGETQDPNQLSFNLKTHLNIKPPLIGGQRGGGGGFGA